MKSLGIIGQGSFGAFVAAQMQPFFAVQTYSRRRGDNDEVLARVAHCDFVMLCIPLNSYEEMLAKLSPLLPKTSVLIDVCSVKEKPLELIEAALPGHPVLATHPLFGPESAAQSLVGHTLVICPGPYSIDDIQDQAVDFAESLGLDVRVMSPTEHDEMVADLHGLTFFIAQALVEYGVRGREVIIPSYKKLLDLAEVERHHSPELFATIEQGNRFAADSRRKFIEVMEAIDKRLAKSE
jgi:prephenate dehydrogenase